MVIEDGPLATPKKELEFERADLQIFLKFFLCYVSLLARFNQITVCELLIFETVQVFTLCLNFMAFGQFDGLYIFFNNKDHMPKITFRNLYTYISLILLVLKVFL